MGEPEEMTFTAAIPVPAGRGAPSRAARAPAAVFGSGTAGKLMGSRLEAVFQEWRAPFASCIAEAQTIGEIDSTFDPMDLAESILASWERAILRMKVERGPAALERFKKLIFQTVFKEQK